MSGLRSWALVRWEGPQVQLLQACALASLRCLAALEPGKDPGGGGLQGGALTSGDSRRFSAPWAHAHLCLETVLLFPTGQHLSRCSSLAQQALPCHRQRAHLCLPSVVWTWLGSLCLREPETGYPPSVQAQRARSSQAAGRVPASTLGLRGKVGPVWGVADPVFPLLHSR